MKSNRIRWKGAVSHMGEKRGVQLVLVGNMRERDYLGDPSIDGRIILI